MTKLFLKHYKQRPHNLKKIVGPTKYILASQYGRSSKYSKLYFYNGWWSKPADLTKRGQQKGLVIRNPKTPSDTYRYAAKCTTLLTFACHQKHRLLFN